MKDFIITAYFTDITATFRVRALDLDAAKFRIEKMGFNIIKAEELY